MQPRILTHTGLSILLGMAAMAPAAEPAAGVNPWAHYRFAPDALQEIDLASATAWSLTVDDGVVRPIQVTAGGWNSDQQTPRIPSAEVKDHVLYQREIDIPAAARDLVVKVLFGGCNYGAEVLLDGKKVTEHHAPMTPFEADLTALAHPGHKHQLQVKAYSRTHFGTPPTVTAGFDFNAGMTQTQEYQGCTKYAYGLTGYVRLALYPQVSISDTQVRPSVSRDALEVRTWICNSTGQEQRIVLAATLDPWQHGQWRYPAIPGVAVTLPAHSTQQVTLGPVKWGLGPRSYWWPNIPFTEDYRATLHQLKLEVCDDGAPPRRVWHQRVQRFGFVEYQEGPYYYTVNGVRITSISDSNSYGQVGEYDCWTETPCFQPPHAGVTGCPETWRRYQRIGFNSMRLSTSVPTRYMLETADEAGYMLVPEGGSWGNGTCKFDQRNFTRQLQAMILACRNHPSVARYSLANESIEGDGGEWRWLIDAAQAADDTRPYVFEVNPTRGDAPFKGMHGGHAYPMQHYDPIVKGGDRIRGMGECAWSTDGMADFTMQAIKLRINDWTHFAPWSWVNFWPNFLEGMNAERHPWKFNNYGDRKDGVDGWNSPIIRAVQWALHPYLLIDGDLLETNPLIKENSKSGKVDWPYLVPAYAAGTKIERYITVFNNSLTAGALALNWTARWDDPAGPVAGTGTVGPVRIEPGFHATLSVTLPAPPPARARRTLHLVLEALKDGTAVNRDAQIHFTVTP